MTERSPYPRIRQRYNRRSRAYAALVDPLEAPIRSASIDLLDPVDGEAVVDIGCGTGAATVAIGGRISPNGIVVGIDLAPAMCELTVRRLRQHGVHNAMVVEGEATVLPIVSDSVDAVFVSFVLDLLTPADVMATLAEIARALDVNGRLCVVALAASERSVGGSIYTQLRRLAPSLLDCRPIPTVELLEAASFTPYRRLAITHWGLPIEAILARPPQASA